MVSEVRSWEQGARSGQRNRRVIGYRLLLIGKSSRVKGFASRGEHRAAFAEATACQGIGESSMSRSGRREAPGYLFSVLSYWGDAGEPPLPKATDAPGTPASTGNQLSSIGRIRTRREIE